MDSAEDNTILDFKIDEDQITHCSNTFRHFGQAQPFLNLRHLLRRASSFRLRTPNFMDVIDLTIIPGLLLLIEKQDGLPVGVAPAIWKSQWSSIQKLIYLSIANRIARAIAKAILSPAISSFDLGPESIWQSMVFPLLR